MRTLARQGMTLYPWPSLAHACSILAPCPLRGGRVRVPGNAAEAEHCSPDFLPAGMEARGRRTLARQGMTLYPWPSLAHACSILAPCPLRGGRVRVPGNAAEAEHCSPDFLPAGMEARGRRTLARQGMTLYPWPSLSHACSILAPCPLRGGRMRVPGSATEASASAPAHAFSNIMLSRAVAAKTSLQGLMPLFLAADTSPSCNTQGKLYGVGRQLSLDTCSLTQARRGSLNCRLEPHTR